MAKIRHFDSFGAVFQHFAPINVKFGTGERSPVPKQFFPLGGVQGAQGPLM